MTKRQNISCNGVTGSGEGCHQETWGPLSREQRSQEGTEQLKRRGALETVQMAQQLTATESRRSPPSPPWYHQLLH